MSSRLLEVKDLQTYFFTDQGTVKAVDGVSFAIEKGETLGIVGESGSGKSVTAASIMQLVPSPPGDIVGGEINFKGENLLDLKMKRIRKIRGNEISMIFQEPLLALDPVYTVGDQITEAILRHEKISRAEAHQRALALFERVRIPSPERRLTAYPHEMSGGMRQRAMISLALASNPKLLLADEPTTALDATVQIQILLLLRELQRELGLSVIFVTHDIGAAVEVADRIAVMYAGRIVEEGPVRTLIRNPAHPYTKALLRSVSHGSFAKGSRLDTIAGSPPDLANLPPGCSFADRCDEAIDDCRKAAPEEVWLDDHHRARCIRIIPKPVGAE